MSLSRRQIDVSAFLIDPAQTIEESPIDWTRLFGNDRPIELEVGSGKGLFLVNSAMANPAHNFLGIELSRKYATLCAERLSQREISNAKVWRGDARLVLTRHVPGVSLRAVHVYFPDPWWKKRHKKRRVFTDSLVTDIERTLEPRGQLRVASDVEEYFGLIQSLITAHPRFQEVPIPEPNEAQHSSDYLTNFERKYRIEGRPIYRADYVLAPADSAY
jgi:tRNA (guanine-N7-)-methyltransferase